MSEKKYYMFHKPFGCVTAKHDASEYTVMDYIRKTQIGDSTLVESLFPVGRLDKDTEGLLIITNDGKWANAMMQPANKVPKTYEFYALGQWNPQKTTQMLTGVSLRGQKNLFCADAITVSAVDTWESFRNFHELSHFTSANCHPMQSVLHGQITISSGIKHQVRRMLRSIDCFVIYLKRISIGELELDLDLPAGELRELTLEDRSLACKKIVRGL